MAGEPEAGDGAQQQPSNPAPAPASEAIHGSQVPTASGVQRSNDAPPLLPMMYPLVMPGMLPQHAEQNEHGSGIYAVPYHPFMGPMAGFSPSTLIPLTYKIPTRTNSTGAVGEGQAQEARQQHGPQRQVVVRRFHFAFQLDLALILKLAAVVFLFSQEGSRQRLILLVLFASLVYLYQTGVLGPLIRWIRRGGAPPPPPQPPQARPPIQLENGPLNGHNDRIDRHPEENSGLENQQQPPETENPPAANDDQPEPERGNGANWWGIAKEIQTFVVGFVTSLFPGFHPHND